MNFIGKKRKSGTAESGKKVILCLCALAAVMGSLCFADWGFAQEVKIDFEMIPGDSPCDNLTISTQFKDSHGMTFGIDTNGDGFADPGVYPRLERSGSSNDSGNAFAYNGGDNAHKDFKEELGQYFLAYDGFNTSTSLIIFYTSPVSSVNGQIWDIEWDGGKYEQWKIEVMGKGYLSGQNDVIESAISPNSGLAGKPWPWPFSHSSNDIYAVRISYIGKATGKGIGVGFDNFTAEKDKEPEPCIQPVDFETVPGAFPYDNLQIHKQYAAADCGMTFKLDTNGDGFPEEAYPRIEATGGKDKGWAFLDGLGRQDRPAKGYENELGEFFLAYDKPRKTTKLIILYDPENPVRYASGDIWDIEGGTEQWRVEAMGEGYLSKKDDIVGSDISPKKGFNGKPWTWSFAHDESDIYAVRISFIGKSGESGLGLGFDNFYAGDEPPEVKDACEETPTVVSNPTVPSKDCEDTSLCGDWNDARNWIPRKPKKGDWVLVKEEHTIIMPNTLVDLGKGGICNKGVLQSKLNKKGVHTKINIKAASICNEGEIEGMDGYPPKDEILHSSAPLRWMDPWTWATTDAPPWRAGSDIRIKSTVFKNTGTIKAGDGADGQLFGGRGGEVIVRSDTLINDGDIQAGNGADAIREHPYTRGGKGGRIRLIAKKNNPNNGSGNTGTVESGSGGSSGTGRERKGGNIIIAMAKLGGDIIVAEGGKLKWDPANLKALPGLNIDGGDAVDIISGPGGTIDLTQLKAGAISAGEINIITKSLNGQGGIVDLSGLNTQVFKTDNLAIFADRVLSSVSTVNSLTNGTVSTSPGKTVSRIFLSAEEEDIAAYPGQTVSVPVTLTNLGDATDTFTVTVSNAKGWAFDKTSETVTVESGDEIELEFEITASQTDGEENTVTIRAVSRSDSQSSATAQAEILVTDPRIFFADKEAGEDTDRDDMPDEWETDNGLDPTVPDAMEDPDGDGYCNLHEYQADTDPQDAESYPASGDEFISGVFTVGETGEVKADWLYDGGIYKSELGIFSLSGMDAYILNSQEFIKEAAKRALSNTEQGYVVLSDAEEGARFNGVLGSATEKDRNEGLYKGVKTFAMKPGDKFATVMVPNSTLKELLADPETPDANKIPIFSLSLLNPAYDMYFGQLAKIDEIGNAFVFEDMLLDADSDRDYNDLIVQITGVSVYAPTLDNPELGMSNDWRTVENPVIPHIMVSEPDPETLWMTVTLKSPADLIVYDPAGRSIGKNGGNIPGATFEFDENGHQIVSLPTAEWTESGYYRIVLQGINGGGLCHLELKGFKGKTEISSQETPFNIEPHQTLVTYISAEDFLDFGTVEFDAPAAPLSFEENPLLFDFDADGDTDDTDISRVSSVWNTCNGDENFDQFYDLDGDGCITIMDIMQVSGSMSVPSE